MIRKKKKNPRSIDRSKQVRYVCKCNHSKEKETFSSLFEKLATVVILNPDFFNGYWDLVEKIINLF